MRLMLRRGKFENRRYFLGLADPDQKSRSDSRRDNPEDDSCSVSGERPKPISFLKAILLPGVVAVSYNFFVLVTTTFTNGHLRITLVLARLRLFEIGQLFDILLVALLFE